MSKPKKAKAIKSVNAKELKAWLRGIQEFQPEGWVPSVDQWEAIRERIFLLEEVEPYVETYTHVPQQHYVPEPVYTAAIPAFAAAQPHVAHNDSGKLATFVSPTETGVIQVTNAEETPDGKYKSSFS